MPRMPQPLRCPWIAIAATVAQRYHRRQANAVYAYAGATGSEYGIVTVQHLVNLARDVGRIHGAAAGLVCVVIQLAEHSCHALVERAVRPVALQFVVLDEVNASFSQHANLRVCSSSAAYAGLDDGTDHRSPIHTSQPSRSFYAELRTLIDIKGETPAAISHR